MKIVVRLALSPAEEQGVHRNPRSDTTLAIYRIKSKMQNTNSSAIFVADRTGNMIGSVEVNRGINMGKELDRCPKDAGSKLLFLRESLDQLMQRLLASMLLRVQ